MLELEEEIQRPTGIWTVKPPKLTIRGLLISKECGVMYEVNRTDGLRFDFIRSRMDARNERTSPGPKPFSAKSLLVS